MTDSELKVNDRRMFTADGELREEFRHLEDAPEPSREAEAVTDQPPPAPVEEAPPEPVAESAGPEVGPQPPGTSSGPEFRDLVGLLAEYAAVYMGDAATGDGRSIVDLRAAQAHIDLLDVLRRKTRGNLTEVEDKFLEEVLYGLRMAYVEKRRQEG